MKIEVHLVLIVSRKIRDHNLILSNEPGHFRPG
jgi:hypothetical protein